MDLLPEIKGLCDLYHIKPNHSKGQNFLISTTVYRQIIEAATLTKEDTVLEIGPGLGYLTKLLADKAGQVVAVELDARLANILPHRLKSQGVDNVKVIEADILQLNLAKLGADFRAGNFQIVANLPYNITSFFLRQYLSGLLRPRKMVLMIQDEVAHRLTAKPGDMSLLGLSAAYYCRAEYLFKVSSKNFWPQPKVQSAVVRLTLKSDEELPLPIGSEKDFFRLAKIGFSAKRKMLKNNLQSGLRLDSITVKQAMDFAGLGEKIRAEDLTLDDWVKLLGYL